MPSKYFNIIAVVLFVIYFLNGIIAIPKLSVTFDEGDNLSYAIRFVKGHPEKIKPYDDASTMPMLAFNAFPRAFNQILNPRLKKNDNGESDIMGGRYITLFLSAFIGLLILGWSTELYGKKAGLLSLFLFVFCPNINGNAVLVTTDALSCLLTISSSYYFWKLIHQHSWRNVFLFAVSLGVAQLTKQSLTHLLIIFPLLLIVLFLKNKRLPVINKNVAWKFITFIIIFVVVVNVGFFFNGTGQSLSGYHFRSSFFKSVQNSLSFAGSIPLPFPEPYISGLDLTKNLDEMGTGRPETAGNVNILGESRAKSGFWYYYFVTLFFKTPIPVLILCIMLIYSFARQREFSLMNEFVPLFCLLYFMGYFSFFYNSQVGIRHIIMIFPLLYVLLGRVTDWLFGKKIGAFFLLGYSIVTFYVFFPNLIAYSNEFILNKKNAYNIIGSANIDYGQSNYFVNKYMEKHPSVKFATDNPASGQFLLSIAGYLDLNNTGRYKWLQNFKPAGHVAHSFLLFNISVDDLESMKR